MVHNRAGRGEKREWVFMETINLLKCHNKKRVAVTNRPNELQAVKAIQRMTVYQNGKAGQKEIMIRYPSKNKRQV